MLSTIIYLFLLTTMLIVLYFCGKELKNDFRFLSTYGLLAILVYTFNEGSRFGRGIDYNIYWMQYDQFAAGWYSSKEFLFDLLRHILIALNLPFQSLIVIMSFVFIVATLFLLKAFKLVLPLALPLFVLFSLYDVENMVRWYLAYSFFLIGLSYLIIEERINWRYLLFSYIGCSFHFAFFPIPILFYLVYLRKGILLHPMISIPLFLLLYMFFQTDMLLPLVEYVNQIADLFTMFSGYFDNTEYWLTGGFNGNEQKGTIDVFYILFLLCVAWIGNKVTPLMGRKYIFSYNLYIIGMILLPIAKKIELFARYDSVFFFFIAIVLAGIIYSLFIWKISIIPQRLLIFVVLLFLNSIKPFYTVPIKMNPERYLYVWDKENKTPNYMLNIYLNDLYKNSR